MTIALAHRATRRSLIWGSLLIFPILVAGCAPDAPTGIAARELAGELRIGDEIAAIVVEIVPAGAADSIRIGSADEVSVSPLVRDQMVVLPAPERATLPSNLRLRVFGSRTTPAALIVRSVVGARGQSISIDSVRLVR